MAANRERRAGAGKRNYSSTALDELRAIRSGEGHITRAQQVVLQGNEDNYEEMDAATYAAYMKQRRETDANFVEVRREKERE